MPTHPVTAWQARKKPSRKTGAFGPSHVTGTHVPPVVRGDPFNARNIVHDGDFYMQGKPRAWPGTHVNHYFAIPEQQSIMERFYGFVRKLQYNRGISTPSGRAEVQGAISRDVNVDMPGVMTFGDFATYAGRSRQAIGTIPGR